MINSKITNLHSYVIHKRILIGLFSNQIPLRVAVNRYKYSLHMPLHHYGISNFDEITRL